jgi:hypothetical protein
LVRVVKYTPFAILVLVALVSGAFVGSRYEVKRDQPIEQQIEQQGAVPPTPTPMLGVPAENLGSYDKGYPSVGYECFDKVTETDNSMVHQIEQLLQGRGRAVYRVCVYGDKAIVASVNKAKDLGGDLYGMAVDIYTISSQDELTFSNIFVSLEEDIYHFRLADWTTNGDVVYALFERRLIGMRLYPVEVYHFNINDADSRPKLVEYCEYSMAGGTAERYFTTCVSFTGDIKSSFLNEDDLP